METNLASEKYRFAERLIRFILINEKKINNTFNKFNKFLFLFSSNLQTQLLSSKKHRNFLQETNKKQTDKKKLVQR